MKKSVLWYGNHSLTHYLFVDLLEKAFNLEIRVLDHFDFLLRAKRVGGKALLADAQASLLRGPPEWRDPSFFITTAVWDDDGGIYEGDLPLYRELSELFPKMMIISMSLRRGPQLPEYLCGLGVSHLAYEDGNLMERLGSILTAA